MKRGIISLGNTPNKPAEKREKRNRGSDGSVRKPFFTTPKRSPVKKVATKSALSSPAKYHKWIKEEDKALVEFISMAKMDPSYDWPDKSVEWPAFRVNNIIWQDAARHIQDSTSSNFLLTSSRVRGRLLTVLKEKFKTLSEAEEYHGLSLAYYLKGLELNDFEKKNERMAGVDKCTQTRSTSTSTCNTNSQKSIATVLRELEVLNLDLSIQVANYLFLRLATAAGVTNNPGDFITLSLSAMARLENKNICNLLYKFAYCLATNRPGSDEPLLPMDRMPFGLISYQIQFFSCTTINQISVPPDFAIWHETMCTEFPSRFNRLFRGPMWSSLSPQEFKYPLKAKVNVAAPSLQLVEKRTLSSEFTEKPDLQIAALKSLKKCNPKGRYWIKVDATDVKPALQESVCGEWNGDICLGDNALDQLKSDYKRRKDVSTWESEESEKLQRAISTIILDLENDILFLMEGLQAADDTYLKKFGCPNTSKEHLKELCWERVEYNTLIQQAHSFKSHMQLLLSHLSPECLNIKEVKSCLMNLKMDFFKYLRNVFVKKRQPAAIHILVFLLSDERRVTKPYALPIQYIPYKSIKDQYIRDMTNQIKKAMVDHNMHPVGTVTDGEFSSLRTQGETRPLHIIQIIHDAKEGVSKQSIATLLSMLIKVGEDAHGQPLVSRPNKYITGGAINELHSLMFVHNMPLDDAITYMRGKLVPAGYSPYSYRANTPESLLDKVRSLVATYTYRGIIDDYQSAGVPFKQHLYWPEIDPLTDDVYHEREDHCHILKRIAKHTREGGYAELNLKGFDDAMLDPGTGLTQATLTGERKQSVQDAERLISYNVARFLREKGYIKEADYINTVAGWHEAADGRGLSELNRCKKNYAMLNMILDDWMPWHSTFYDFSTIDINRPIKGVCGFSRETVIAVTVNIESKEVRRCQAKDIGYQEHPRAGSTDDVEAFFALVHRFLGNIFTLQQFKYAWRKLVREFCKRMNPDLPFYYWTLNERYRDFEDKLPSFNIHPNDDDDDDDDGGGDGNPRQHPLRLHRLTINRREDSLVFVSGRCFLPSRNKTTIRQRLFRPNACLPAFHRDDHDQN